MRVLVYDAFEHVRPIGMGLLQGFTDAGHEAIAAPARAGPLSQYQDLQADLTVIVSMFAHDADVAPWLTQPAPFPIEGFVQIERTLRGPRPSGRFVLVHTPEAPHASCAKADACFAIGRTKPISGAKCRPMLFASSLNVPDVPRLWDVIFIGSWGVSGHGERGQKWIDLSAKSRRALIIGGEDPMTHVSARMLGWLYSAAKVGLNPLYDAQIGRGEVNERAFDLARCGVAQITNSEAVKDVLGGHALVGAPTEFPDLVERLLRDHEHRESLVKGAQGHAAEHHLWADRARAIIAAGL